MSSRRLRYHTQPVSATEDTLRTIVDNGYIACTGIEDLDKTLLSTHV